MSKKAGNILVRLWTYLDQGAHDMDILYAFKSCPTSVQRELIERFLNGRFLLDSFDDKQEIEKVRQEAFAYLQQTSEK